MGLAPDVEASSVLFRELPRFPGVEGRSARIASSPSGRSAGRRAPPLTP